MRVYPGISLGSFSDPEARSQVKVMDDALRDITAALSRSVFAGTQPAANPISAQPSPGASPFPQPTQGDTLYGLITGSWAKLSIGASGKFLRSDGTSPSWQLLAASDLAAHNLLSTQHADTTAASPPGRGDVITGQGTPTASWSKLLRGATGTFLRSDGTDTLFATIAASDLPAHNLLSTQHGDTTATSPPGRGDVIAGDVNLKWVRKVRGASGTFVRSDGADTSFSAIQAADLPTHDHTKHTDRTRRVPIPIGSWENNTKSNIGTEPNVAAAITMPATSRTHVIFRIPVDFASTPLLNIYWASNGADVTDFTLRVYTKKLVAATTNITAAYDNSDIPDTSSPVGTNIFTSSGFAISTVLVAGDIVRWTFERGADGNPNALNFLGADLEYVADM